MNITPLLADETLYSRTAETLPSERWERIERIRPARERCLSLGGSLLLIDVLLEYGIAAPSFGYGENGKPYLPDFPRLHFNISHAGEYAICAVSDNPVGCDIEKMRPYRQQLAERVLSAEELSQFAAEKDKSSRDTLFFRFWTLKESFLKAFGCGITVQLPSVSFNLTGKEPVVTQQITGERYSFYEYDAFPGYRCALCKKDGGAFPPLTIKTINEVGVLI